MNFRFAPQAESDLDEIWYFLSQLKAATYRVDGDDVLVLRVLRGSRDIEALFRD